MNLNQKKFECWLAHSGSQPFVCETGPSGTCFTKNLTTNRNRISYISTLSYAYDLS